MDMFEILATAMGIIQGALVWADKRSNWIFYCLQYIFMAVFSVKAHLYGDVGSCVLYFAVGIAGWFLWSRESNASIRRCSRKERCIYIGVLSLLSVALWLGLKRTDDPLPLLDALTTAGGYVATYYMLMKKVDTWIIWFFVDVLYIAEYYLLPDRAWYLMALNIIWTGMSVGSFLSWNKKAEGERV